jgi:hypothetical protein
MSSYRCFDAVERIRRARDETAKVFGGIVQVVKAVFIVIIDKEARVKAIQCTAIGNLDHSLKQDCATIPIYLKGASDGQTKNLHPRV